jgi:hypothetical protein
VTNATLPVREDIVLRPLPFFEMRARLSGSVHFSETGTFALAIEGAGRRSIRTYPLFWDGSKKDVW